MNIIRARNIIDGFLAQASDYGLAHAVRQNYLIHLSPALKTMLRHRVPAWLESVPIKTTGGLSVHMLLCARDVRMGLCAAVSFVLQYGSNVSLCFHDDGSLRSEHVAYINRIFPNARIVLRAQSDAEINNWLTDCPLSRSLRRQCFMLVKFFDPLFYGTGEWRLLLDSDVMFFKSPVLLREIVAKGAHCNWFNRDISSSYCLQERQAVQLIGRPLIERLNAGLALIHRESVLLEKCDSYLAACDFVSRPWLIEQTLHAMFSTAFGASHLPQEYELTLERRAKSSSISKHYVGRMTEMFYLDGLATLLKSSR